MAPKIISIAILFLIITGFLNKLSINKKVDIEKMNPLKFL